MDIPDDHPVLTLIVDEGCDDCGFMRERVDEVVADNAALDIEVASFDAWDDPDAVIEFDALSHPTVVLFVNGHERARVAGAVTKRHFLRKTLPYLYPEPGEADEQLRLQTGNPSEKFKSPRLSLRRGGNVDTVEALRRVPLFTGLSKRQLGLIARYADETFAEEGQVLAVQGDVGDEFYLLCEGSAVVDRDGTEIAKLTEGGFFGEMALLDGEPRSASVRVTEDSRLLAIHRRDFSHLLDRIPEIARGMLTELTRRVREADRRLVS